MDDLAGAGIPEATVARIKPLVVARPLPSPVDVNAATAGQLETLPGVGPALARAIIEARPYQRFDDLGRIKGLGTAKLDALRGRVSFGKATTVAEKVKAKLGEVKSEAVSKADAAKAEMKDKVGEVKDVVKAKAGEVKDEVKDKVGDVKKVVKAKAGEVKDTVKAKAGEVKDTVKAKAGEVRKEMTRDKPDSGKRININTATKDELDELYGIGPVLAQAIIDGRPYEKIEDIMKVRGIKSVEFNKIKDRITVK